jgi:hypothetical protein
VNAMKPATRNMIGFFGMFIIDPSDEVRCGVAFLTVTTLNAKHIR